MSPSPRCTSVLGKADPHCLGVPTYFVENAGKVGAIAEFASVLDSFRPFQIGQKAVSSFDRVHDPKSPARQGRLWTGVVKREWPLTEIR